MPNDALTVTPAATRADLDTAAEILDEAATWLASRGLPGWEPGGFGASGTIERRAIEDAFRKGQLYLVWERASAVATVSLLDEDSLYWPNAPADGAFVHRLAVRRSAAGRGIGAAVLRWAEREALARGKRHLRLDCVTRDT